MFDEQNDCLAIASYQSILVYLLASNIWSDFICFSEFFDYSLITNLYLVIRAQRLAQRSQNPSFVEWWK